MGLTAIVLGPRWPDAFQRLPRMLAGLARDERVRWRGQASVAVTSNVRRRPDGTAVPLMRLSMFGLLAAQMVMGRAIVPSERFALVSGFEAELFNRWQAAALLRRRRSTHRLPMKI
jgi:hypothetical protein